MIVLTYELIPLEPLLVSRPDRDANSVIAYPYVPGSVIRGALANRYLPRNDFDLAGDDASRRLFFEPTTRYLNACPLTPGGARTLPAPLTWRKEKDAALKAGAPLYDVSVKSEAPATEPGKQFKALGEYFCAVEGTQAALVKVDRDVNVHTQRERVKGRATQEAGAIFRNHAIPAGTRLGGILLVEDAAAAQTLREHLDGADLWLGRSRSGGYGHARVVLHATPPKNWWPETPWPGALRKDDTLTITLLSDVVLRQPDGAYAYTLDPALLPESLTGALTLEHTFKRTTLVGSFNRKWGLPGIQSHALAAGSVFIYKVTHPLGETALRDFQEQGLGEQQVEGLGRVALNWPGQPTLTVAEAPSTSLAAAPVVLTLPGRKLAEEMVNRLLARELDQRVADYAYRLELQGTWPTNAQLARLRTLVLNANGPAPDVARVLTFLLDANLKPRARDQYRAARIQMGAESTRLLHWLVELLLEALTADERTAFQEKYAQARIDNRPVAEWLHRREGQPTLLAACLSEVTVPTIGAEIQATVTPDMQKAYTLRLIAGVLHRATKERNHE